MEMQAGDLLGSIRADLDRLEADSPDASRETIASIKASIDKLADSLGECQEDVPYSPMRPIRRPGGVVEWCCNHHPEHCNPGI
jgi:hypothetical protein